MTPFEQKEAVGPCPYVLDGAELEDLLDHRPDLTDDELLKIIT